MFREPSLRVEADFVDVDYRQEGVLYFLENQNLTGPSRCQ
jgi:hypothetical protein